MNPKQHLKMFVEDQTSGQIICNCGCGHVVEEKTISTLDERPDGDKIVISRPKNTLARHDLNISTKFTNDKTDHVGRTISIKSQQMNHKLQQWDTWTTSSPESRRMAVGLDAIKKICEKMMFSKMILENASFIYRKAQKNMKMKGRPVQATAIACIYHALKMANIHVKYFDLCSKCEISWRQAKKMQYEITVSLDFVEKSGGTSPINYIEKAIEKLGLSKKTGLFAADIANIVSAKSLLEGRAPRGVAAACIYLANLSLNPKSKYPGYFFHVNQNGITDELEVTSVTIRNHAREIIPHIKDAVAKYKGEMPT